MTFQFQDCEKGTAKCVTLSCKIYNMPSKSEAYVHIKSRLWNSTLVADYPRVDLIKIVSSAQISIPEIYNIQQTRRDDMATVNLIFSSVVEKCPKLMPISIAGRDICLSRFT